jgi:hypothetical protein
LPSLANISSSSSLPTLARARFMLFSSHVHLYAGEKVSVSCTSIYDSVDGHNIIFLADESREANGELKFVDKQ